MLWNNTIYNNTERVFRLIAAEMRLDPADKREAIRKLSREWLCIIYCSHIIIIIIIITRL